MITHEKMTIKDLVQRIIDIELCPICLPGHKNELSRAYDILKTYPSNIYDEEVLKIAKTIESYNCDPVNKDGETAFDMDQKFMY